jgi:hypothetical protein
VGHWDRLQVSVWVAGSSLQLFFRLATSLQSKPLFKTAMPLCLAALRFYSEAKRPLNWLSADGCIVGSLTRVHGPRQLESRDVRSTDWRVVFVQLQLSLPNIWEAFATALINRNPFRESSGGHSMNYCWAPNCRTLFIDWKQIPCWWRQEQHRALSAEVKHMIK